MPTEAPRFSDRTGASSIATTAGTITSVPIPSAIPGTSTTATAAIENDLIALGSVPGEREATTLAWWVVLLLLLLAAVLAAVVIAWTRSKRTKNMDPETGTTVEPIYSSITHRGGHERSNPAYTGAGANPAGDHGAALRNSLYAELSARPGGALTNGLYGDIDPAQACAWGSNDRVVPRGRTRAGPTDHDDQPYSGGRAPSPDSHYKDIMPQPEGIYDTPFLPTSAGKSLYDTPTTSGPKKRKPGGGTAGFLLGRDKPIHGSAIAASGACTEPGSSMVLPGSMFATVGPCKTGSVATAICPIPVGKKPRNISRRRGSTLLALRKEAAVSSSGHEYRDIMPTLNDGFTQPGGTLDPQYFNPAPQGGAGYAVPEPAVVAGPDYIAVNGGVSGTENEPPSPRYFNPAQQCDAVYAAEEPPAVAPDYIDVKGRGIAEGGQGNVLYDFTSSQPGELSVKSGDVVRIITPDTAGWTEVSGASGSVGFVPTPYIYA